MAGPGGGGDGEAPVEEATRTRRGVAMHPASTSSGDGWALDPVYVGPPDASKGEAGAEDAGDEAGDFGRGDGEVPNLADGSPRRHPSEVPAGGR